MAAHSVGASGSQEASSLGTRGAAVSSPLTDVGRETPILAASERTAAASSSPAAKTAATGRQTSETARDAASAPGLRRMRCVLRSMWYSGCHSARVTAATAAGVTVAGGVARAAIFVATIVAKSARRKPQPSRAPAKTTFPLMGQKRPSSGSESCAAAASVASVAFTLATASTTRWHASSGSSLATVKSLSHLFSTRMELCSEPASMAAVTTRAVWMRTPSRTSTTTRVPSPPTRSADDTSREKSTWPGESTSDKTR
mmetsp:Transcript_8521/g.27168  ORF Transcript_8521/g.27168 Transcript_8521/m.27168 type:complete len:257 (+) Transcript_8521:442-1212(+)